jgi:hypothetical protein
VCGSREVGAIFTPAHSMDADGIELALRGGGRRAVEFTLAPVDGPPLLAGTLRRTSGARGRVVSAAAASVELRPGVAYVLRVRSPAAASDCIALDALTTELPLGAAASGLRTTAVLATDDGGASWRTERVATIAGALSARGQRCGNGHREGHESCDGTDDAACPGRCTTVCTCAGATSTTATTTSTTSTTLAARRYRSIYTSGYLGVYDPATIPVWPKKLGVILGGPDVQGPIIDDAKQVAAAAGNTDARFVFYLNLTSLDSKCGCFEARFYQSVASTHPEWFLRDASGSRISAFVTQYGAGRLWTVDIGNPAFIDGWADTVIAEMDRHGWDGVWADNILRGNFYDWSAWPGEPAHGRRIHDRRVPRGHARRPAPPPLAPRRAGEDPDRQLRLGVGAGHARRSRRAAADRGHARRRGRGLRLHVQRHAAFRDDVDEPAQVPRLREPTRRPHPVPRAGTARSATRRSATTSWRAISSRRSASRTSGS